MSGKTYFITGTNRGIGLEMVKIISKIPQNVVIASTRNIEKSTELNKLAKERTNIHIVQFDVSSEKSIESLDAQLSKVAKDGIDVFISNAGLASPDVIGPIFDTKWDAWIKHFETNTIGPVFTTKVVYPYLLKKQTRKIFFISTNAATLSAFYKFSSSAYGASKAALNHAALSLNMDLEGEGFIVALFHPGVVDTDMYHGVKEKMEIDIPGTAASFENMIISTEESATGLVKLFEEITTEKGGKFLNYDGTEAPF